MCLLFKILNDKAPKLVIQLKPKAISRRTSYNTRNTADLDPPKCRTEQYTRSFFPSTTKLWNQLHREIKETMMSVETFKHRIRPETKVIFPYLSYGDRKANILVTRLRLNNADLNQNLHNKLMAPSPMCACYESEETTTHYLLQCDNYEDQRLILKEKIQSIAPNKVADVNLILSGSSDLGIDKNCDILKATMDYIISTKRFE